MNVDPLGIGPAGFGDRIFVTQTHVGGFDFIPAQPDRSVDAEAGLADGQAARMPGGCTRSQAEHLNESDNTTSTCGTPTTTAPPGARRCG